VFAHRRAGLNATQFAPFWITFFSGTGSILSPCSYGARRRAPFRGSPLSRVNVKSRMRWRFTGCWPPLPIRAGYVSSRRGT